MKNPIFKKAVPQSAKGYSAFPLDELANFTSVCGYLLPVYWTWLNPGDKVTMSSLLRTRTQPFTKPSMGTIIERVEWFAVPIDQLYKPFSAKYYGINDIGTDMLPTNGYNPTLPYISGNMLHDFIKSCPTSFSTQGSLPVSRPTCHEAKRLIDCLGGNRSLGKAEIGATNVIPFSACALPFAAYQKIYSDHYRLTDREENDPASYNLDSYYNTLVITDTDRLNKLCMLHKRPYQLDYFTSMEVSPLMGSQDVNASGVDLTSLNQWLTGLTGLSTAVPNQVGSALRGGYVAASDQEPSSTRFSTNSPTSNVAIGLVNPANIRSMFAVEKLLEVTRKAKKHYDMQTLAHFGVDVPKGLSGECFKLGTQEQFVQIGEVLSTAETSEGSLGERAGVGSSNTGKPDKFHFEAKCHCILMAIYSAEPIMNYRNDGVPRKLTLTSTTDFYKSEFDNLGQQPVFLRELIMGDISPEDAGIYTSVIGWQKRYAELKSAVNRSFAGQAEDYFKEWAFNRSPVPVSTLSRNFFFVWPTDLNDNLLVQYIGTGNADTAYASDYFINQIYFNVIKSSKMSIYGMPNL